jgi:transcriptional regulator with XRE-family HTH domain
VDAQYGKAVVLSDVELDMYAFGVGLMQRRRAAGMSRNGLSRESGVANPQLARLESGEATHVGVVTVARLAKALGASVDDLLRDAGIQTGAELDGDLAGWWRELDADERKFILTMGRALYRMRLHRAGLSQAAIDLVPLDPDEPIEYLLHESDVG